MRVSVCWFVVVSTWVIYLKAAPRDYNCRSVSRLGLDGAKKRKPTLVVAVVVGRGGGGEEAKKLEGDVGEGEEERPRFSGLKLMINAA